MLRRSLLAAGGALAVLGLARQAVTAENGSPSRFVPVPAGSAAPPALVLSDLTGVRHDLAEYRGRVVLINFWATWCAPCLAEIPSLELLQSRLRNDPVDVLMVNYGESVERVSAFVETMAVELPVLLDAFHRVRHDWKVRALPMSFLVDRRGRLRYVVRGELDWNSEEAVARIEALASEK
jgi:thiol-disulfide isomerase/thioredoxin